jgi:hypothetical protein
LGKFKLGIADSPFKHTTPASYALAAISAVANDPNQMRSLVSGSLISVTHFPHARMRTPLNSVGFAAGEESELRRLEVAFFAKLFSTGPRRKLLPRLATKEDSDFAFSTISTHNNPHLLLKFKTPKTSLPLFDADTPTHSQARITPKAETAVFFFFFFFSFFSFFFCEECALRIVMEMLASK